MPLIANGDRADLVADIEDRPHAIYEVFNHPDRKRGSTVRRAARAACFQVSLFSLKLLEFEMFQQDL